MNIIRVALALASSLFATVALAEPNLLVTVEKSNGKSALVSFDFVADPASPVVAIRAGIDLKRGANLAKRVNLTNCTSGMPNAMSECSADSGDLYFVVFSGGANKGLSSGHIGTVSVPVSLIKTDSAGRVSLKLVEFAGAGAGKLISGAVAGDAVSTSNKK